MQAVIERFPRIAWDRMPSTESNLEALVDKVIASIPDIFIDSPELGGVLLRATSGRAVDADPKQ